MGYTPPQLYITTPTGYTKVYGISTDLVLYPNKNQPRASLTLASGGGTAIDISSGSSFVINEVGSNMLTIKHLDTDVIITNVISNHDLFLKTTGTGKVKFGTHTAQADTPVTGYIDILDASGTARKLAIISP